jgi:pimeloyl-ACP methyl ester carboxylesterase
MTDLAKLLAPRFTVYTYDRRGRGGSGDTRPYAVEREIEDIGALIQEAGGSARLFGTSSGACLVLEAAIKLGKKVNKLALYEPPYQSGNGARQAWRDYRKKLDEFLASGRRGVAVVLFMQFVGTPADQVEGMRQAPAWPIFEAVAPTLVYDAAAMGEDRSVPVKRAAKVASPALVMNGSAIPFMLDTATSLAKAIPHAQQRTLEGQTHNVNLEILAPVLVEYFSK